MTLFIVLILLYTIGKFKFWWIVLAVSVYIIEMVVKSFDRTGSIQEAMRGMKQ